MRIGLAHGGLAAALLLAPCIIHGFVVPDGRQGSWSLLLSPSSLSPSWSSSRTTTRLGIVNPKLLENLLEDIATEQLEREDLELEIQTAELEIAEKKLKLQELIVDVNKKLDRLDRVEAGGERGSWNRLEGLSVELGPAISILVGALATLVVGRAALEKREAIRIEQLLREEEARRIQEEEAASALSKANALTPQQLQIAGVSRLNTFDIVRVKTLSGVQKPCLEKPESQSRSHLTRWMPLLYFFGFTTPAYYRYSLVLSLLWE
jgi:hypothetical protein